MLSMIRLYFFLVILIKPWADDTRWLTVEYTSKATYPIQQIPYKSLAFGGIQGDIPGQLTDWVIQNLRSISGLQLILPETVDARKIPLLSIQGHTNDGLKKIKNTLNVQALLQGQIEIIVKPKLTIQFNLELYDLDSCLVVYRFNRNWVINSASSDQDLLYEIALKKVIRDINADWHTFSVREKVPWLLKMHSKASEVFDLIMSNDFTRAVKFMENEKRSVEVELFRNNSSQFLRNKYQIILFHYGLLFEFNNQLVLARQYYELALRHGENSTAEIIKQSYARVKHRL